MNWRRYAIALHRDVGYFFVGATLLFSVSGLAVNHAGQWDPDFAVTHEEITLELPADPAALTAELIRQALASQGTFGAYRTHDIASDVHLKIYLEDGSILFDLEQGRGNYESVRPRAVLYELNRLHLDPASWWLVFSDVFASGLIFLAITGTVMLRGKHGFVGRGKWLVGSGLIAPIVGFIVVS